MVAVLILALAISDSQQTITLTQGLTIERSSNVRRATYDLPSGSDALADGVLSIKGNDIVVDFKGATLRGTAPDVQPDQRKGVALLVQGKNITIKNLNVRGYRIGLIARNSPGLKLIDCDFSYNWKPRLLSTVDREDGADWMSFHKNENDEWLRYGAGVYLRDCDGFEVRGLRSNGGSCALMITESDDGLVWNSDLSFNSAIGLGMYRSSRNRIMHNRIDWCVRGFSLGRYNRGQDSAGILIYEQSNGNVFAYNSVTHGGDGFFLWAGQTTMDSGKGGCNDNLLYGNDFSHAPTNGIEATFSRNVFANNLVLECWHGIWGGYSYESQVIGNVFGFNSEGIAWEHGQDNKFVGNTFARNNEDIVLWFNDGPQDPSWGYPKFRDTKSRDYAIELNQFADTRSNSLRIRNSSNIGVGRNEFFNVGSLFNVAGNNSGIRFESNFVVGKGLGAEVPKSVVQPAGKTNRFLTSEPYARDPLPPASSLNQGPFTSKEDYLDRFEVTWNGLRPLRDAEDFAPPSGHNAVDALLAMLRPEPLKDGIVPYLKRGTLRGWRYMIVDEWGPYDFKRPLVWPREEVDGLQVFELLGPTGTAKLVSSRGTVIDAISTDGSTWTAGRGPLVQVRMPCFIRAKMLDDQNWQELIFAYTGEAVTDHRGVVTARGKPFTFGWTRFEVPIDWNIAWYGWDSAKVADPRAKMPTPGEVLTRSQLGNPLAKLESKRLDFASSGAPREGVPANHFITLATGAFTIEPGDYEIGVTSDDGVRVWLDDKLIIDEWHWQGPTRYAQNVRLGGRHRIRVEHYEIDGYTALKVELAPKR